MLRRAVALAASFLLAALSTASAHQPSRRISATRSAISRSKAAK
ncbi:MAG: hypothetical protein AB7F37_13650 [Variibacter sp.]